VNSRAHAKKTTKRSWKRANIWAKSAVLWPRSSRWLAGRNRARRPASVSGIASSSSTGRTRRLPAERPASWRATAQACRRHSGQRPPLMSAPRLADQVAVDRVDALVRRQHGLDRGSGLQHDRGQAGVEGVGVSGADEHARAVVEQLGLDHVREGEGGGGDRPRPVAADQDLDRLAGDLPRTARIWPSATTDPPWIITTASQMASTSLRMWLETITNRPPAASSLKSSINLGAPHRVEPVERLVQDQHARRVTERVASLIRCRMPLE